MVVSAFLAREPRSNLIVLKATTALPKQQARPCLITLATKGSIASLRLVSRPRQETTVLKRTTVLQAQASTSTWLIRVTTLIGKLMHRPAVPVAQETTTQTQNAICSNAVLILSSSWWLQVVTCVDSSSQVEMIQANVYYSKQTHSTVKQFRREIWKQFRIAEENSQLTLRGKEIRCSKIFTRLWQKFTNRTTRKTYQIGFETTWT